DKQVAEIYGFFGSLWPKDTDIMALLPKPDLNVLRALYTGIVDPRVIPNNVIGFSPYVDEVIVINPFTNPNWIAKDYSPVYSPAQYKQETLKNVFLLLQLIPFIETGVINLIPDPCDFNIIVRKQLWEIAKDRLKDWNPKQEEMGIMKDLFESDFKNTMTGMPKEIIKHKIKSLSPELSDKEIEDVISHMKKRREKDPFALLQPLPSGVKEGQLSISHMAPNLELGLFLSQITGSFLYTDNEHKRSEIIIFLSLILCLLDEVF
ncbi:unnamed protein product, partial [marine sediment metagenome]